MDEARANRITGVLVRLPRTWASARRRVAHAEAQSWTLPDGPAGVGDYDFELVTPVNDRGHKLRLPTSYAFGAGYVLQAEAVPAVGFGKRSVK